MNPYIITSALSLLIILFWKLMKPKLKGAIQAIHITTFSKMDVEKVKEKQLKNIYIISLLIIFWPLTNYTFAYLIIFLILLLVAYQLPLQQIKYQERKEVEQLKYEFPIWLRQLQVLLQNNNVLHSLEISLKSAPDIMKEDLEKLIGEVRMNATSSAPYYDFMKEYHIYEISRAMKLLYRYHMQGANDSYYQFQRMLESTRKWLRKERQTKKENRASLLNWIGIVPLLGATVMFMILMILVISEMMKNGFTN